MGVQLRGSGLSQVSARLKHGLAKDESQIELFSSLQSKIKHIFCEWVAM
jgi:hypothetical protein